MREALTTLRKLPEALSHLAVIPAGTTVVHVTDPQRTRSLEALEFNVGRNRWQARLDGGTTCDPRALRLSGQQLDLLAPCEGREGWRAMA